MDFKCFMKLLIEKKYIVKKQEFRMKNSKSEEIFAINYKCKYVEVKERIMEEIDNWHACDYLHNIQYQTIDKYFIKIIFKDKVKKQIFNTLHNEEETIIKPINIGYIDLEKLLKYDEDYKIEYNSVWDKWVVRDIKLTKTRKKKEEDEKKECLEFLKQLP